jgi:tetratricopeptide (TPR) repeat protein
MTGGSQRLAIWVISLFLGLWSVVILRVVGAQQTTAQPPATQPAHERFDNLVRDDFFSGDKARFDRAMRLCDQALAKNPNDAQAMVWHGTGLLTLSGEDFQACGAAFGAGNPQLGIDLKKKAIDLWIRGRKEMDNAVALTPDDVAVLIPRGAVYLSIANYDADSVESKRLIKTGVDDYEKVLQIQTEESHFSQLSTHSRGELLFGLAGGWYQLGDVGKSRAYLQRILKDCPESDYSSRAADWLGTSDSAALLKKSQTYSCIGCHSE